MRKLIESTHVSLGGEIGSPQEWAFPYLDDEHARYASGLLAGADALLLGRRTYEGLSAAYTAMASTPFVNRMNSIPKYVASRTLTDLSWNAIVIPADVAGFVAELKRQPGGTIVKYGNGPLDQVLMANNLIDEFHLLLIASGGRVGPAPVRGDRRCSTTLAGTREALRQRRPASGLHAESRRGLTGRGLAGGSKHGRYRRELLNSPLRTPPRKACHSAGVNRRTGPAESLLLRTPIVPPGRLATSTQLPLA